MRVAVLGAGNGGSPQPRTRHGFAKPALVTLDVAEAVTGADLIVIVVPAFGQRPMAELMAPYLRPDRAVLLNPGSTGGALQPACFRDPMRAGLSPNLSAYRRRLWELEDPCTPHSRRRQRVSLPLQTLKWRMKGGP